MVEISEGCNERNSAGSIWYIQASQAFKVLAGTFLCKLFFYN